MRRINESVENPYTSRTLIKLLLLKGQNKTNLYKANPTKVKSANEETSEVQLKGAGRGLVIGNSKKGYVSYDLL